ncbi:MAG: hypothetical protein JO041_08375, partial [Acidobacteria bacterium]|nr:hypothetical protein [Acidobacteriota bacterium]
MKGEDRKMNFDEALEAIRSEAPAPEEISASAERAWQKIEQAYAEPGFTAAAETLRNCTDFRELLAERDAGTITAG